MRSGYFKRGHFESLPAIRERYAIQRNLEPKIIRPFLGGELVDGSVSHRSAALLHHPVLQSYVRGSCLRLTSISSALSGCCSLRLFVCLVVLTASLLVDVAVGREPTGLRCTKQRAQFIVVPSVPPLIFCETVFNAS